MACHNKAYILDLRDIFTNDASSSAKGGREQPIVWSGARTRRGSALEPPAAAVQHALPHTRRARDVPEHAGAGAVQQGAGHAHASHQRARRHDGIQVRRDNT